MNIGRVRLSVYVCVCVSLCLSLAACLHYRTYPAVTWGMVEGSPSCALLGGFAIGARVSLLWQHALLMRNVSEDGCTRCMADFCRVIGWKVISFLEGMLYVAVYFTHENTVGILIIGLNY